jgi:hypothetical protein
VCLVLPTFLALVAFSLTDFQGYPDLYPLLPYAALGIGGTAAVAVRGVAPRRVAVAGALAATVVLAGLSWHTYTGDHRLVRQRAEGAALNRRLASGDTLYALGDPAPLVLTGRRNPSRFIYMGSGVAAWVVGHTPGGLAGWEARIRAVDPAIVTLGGWNGPIRDRLQRWLRAHYRVRHLGRWVLFVKATG